MALLFTEQNGKYFVYEGEKNRDISPNDCKFYKEFNHSLLANLYFRYYEDYIIDLEIAKRKLPEDQHKKVYSYIHDLSSELDHELGIEELFAIYDRKEKEA